MSGFFAPIHNLTKDRHPQEVESCANNLHTMAENRLCTAIRAHTMTVTTERTPDASIVAESSLAIQFQADPEQIRERLVPPPLEPLDGGDRGWIVFSERILPDIRHTGEVPLEKTQYNEVAVGAPCRYGGEKYTVFPLLYLDRLTDRFDRGYVRGIADIAKSWWHETCPGREQPARGDTVVGNACHNGATLADAFLELEDERGRDTLPDHFFDRLHHRHVPARQVDSGRNIANDVGRVEHASTTVGTVWEGNPSITFGNWRNGTLAEMDAEAITGYYLTRQCEILGERTLAEVSPSWGDHLE